jgi:hypothetical protein
MTNCELSDCSCLLLLGKDLIATELNRPTGKRTQGRWTEVTPVRRIKQAYAKGNAPFRLSNQAGTKHHFCQNYPIAFLTRSSMNGAWRKRLPASAMTAFDTAGVISGVAIWPTPVG